MLKCLQKNVPYCINCDGAFIHPNWIKDRVKTLFISHAAACFASGEYAKRYFEYYGAKADKIHFHRFTSLTETDIYSQIAEDNERNTLRDTLDLSPKKTVLTIGQFIYRKGIDVLLRAWTELDPMYQLVIIGGGELEEEYKKQIKELGLQNVIIRGFMKKQELFLYYRASDLFVLPTREDIWGLVINEAMACGLPVVSTDHCIAALELIENGENGYVVPVEQEEKLQVALNKILCDEQLRAYMGKNNLAKMQGCTIQSIVRRHTEVIDTL
jgi:glycosyltransferase involved in cell wall biosynthesis